MNVVRRTKEEAQDTRSRILQSAFDIFCDKNFSNVLITEIAENIGMTKGAVYWHFKSKNDILIQLLEKIFSQTERDFIDICGTPKSFGALRSYYKSTLMHRSQDKHHMNINKLMFRKHEWPEDVQAKALVLIKNSIENERKMLEMLIVKAQTDGKIRSDISPVTVSKVICAVFHGLFILQLGEVLPADFTDHLDFLFDAFAAELKYKAL